MAGVVPAVLPGAVAALLIPAPVIAAAVALTQPERLGVVADNDEAAVLLNSNVPAI